MGHRTIVIGNGIYSRRIRELGAIKGVLSERGLRAPAPGRFAIRIASSFLASTDLGHPNNVAAELRPGAMSLSIHFFRSEADSLPGRLLQCSVIQLSTRGAKAPSK